MLGNFKFERGSLEGKNSHTVWKLGNSPEFLGSLGFFRAFIRERQCSLLREKLCPPPVDNSDC